MVEYAFLHMHYLNGLSLDLNMWFIGFKDKGGDINLPSMSSISFELEFWNFYASHIPTTFVCALALLVLTQTSTRDAPAPVTPQRQATRMGLTLL